MVGEERVLCFWCDEAPRPQPLHLQSRCTCKLGFAGDGYVCSPIDPCRAGNGGCHDLVRGSLRGLRAQGRHLGWGRLAPAVSCLRSGLGSFCIPNLNPVTCLPIR